jgi:hypothetical protein
MPDGKPMVLFTYSTIQYLKKDKIRFYYALKGRDGKSGIFKATNAVQLGRTVLMVSPQFENEFIQFLRVWNLPFTKRKIIIMEEESFEK